MFAIIRTDKSSLRVVTRLIAECPICSRKAVTQDEPAADLAADASRAAHPTWSGDFNRSTPIRITNVQPILGVLAQGAEQGKAVYVLGQLSITSHHAMFRTVASSLAGVIRQWGHQANLAIDITRVSTMLAVLHQDNSVDIWLENLDVCMTCVAKRAMDAGSPVFGNDISDILALTFPDLDISPTDRVIFIFRDGWEFGLAYDLQTGRVFDRPAYERQLGRLMRELRYSDVYQVLQDDAAQAELFRSGWFPFAEIISSEFRTLLAEVGDGSRLLRTEERLLKAFDEARLDRMLDRWLNRAPLHARSALLKSGLSAFIRSDPHACIKILITEIEGVLQDAYREAHEGKTAKLKSLVKFASQLGVKRAGAPQTLLFPESFGSYLTQQTFAAFSPAEGNGSASSRHAVGHGAAQQDSYTMTRALQVILTIDQLAFYM